MDQEFLEKVLACKSADELRELLNSRRQLSDSELEDVVGGTTRNFMRNETSKQFESMWKNVAQGCGYDAAMEAFCKVYGFRPGFSTEFSAGSSDTEKMGAFLGNFLKSMNQMR